MQTGIVKWFHRAQGYGFISPDTGGDDVFVFYPTIETEGDRQLISGQSVSFESIQCHQGLGLRATRVLLN